MLVAMLNCCTKEELATASLVPEAIARRRAVIKAKIRAIGRIMRVLRSSARKLESSAGE
jgi:hypothetical protein